MQKKVIKVADIKTEAEALSCPVERSLYYMNAFLSGPMCGKCFPCSMGSYEAKIILKSLMNGEGSEGELSNLKRIAGEMAESSMCKKGKDTAAFLLEWLGSDVFLKHLDGICPDKTCRSLIEYRIIPNKCTICGICKDVCKYNAIHGDKRKPFQSAYYPFEIRQLKCVKCGDCIGACPDEAIILIDAKSTEPVGA